MNHLTEEDLILLYYNEPSAGATAHQHLSACPVCREALSGLAQTLDTCNAWQPVEPDPAFLARLALLNRPRRRTVFQLTWLAAAALLILSIAFFAGRASRVPQPVPMAGLSQQARARILAISLADHLDRAELLLTEIANSSDAAGDADRARDLVSEGRLLRQSVSGGTGELLDEVERFMLEIANSPAGPAPAQFAAWRERISSASLLFKVRILQSNLRQKEQTL